MKSLTRELPHIDAVVVTHAHGDHSAHAASYAQAFGAPIYMTEPTRRNVRFHAESSPRVYGAEAAFAIGNIEIQPCGVPHDAPQVALRFSAEGESAALVTDLGEVETKLVDHLHGVDILMIESNYDDDMLTCGPYPQHIQDRVRGRFGHLDNLHTAELLREISERTHTVVLMHLSKKNNTEEVARAVARDALSRKQVELSIAQQDTPTEIGRMQQLSLARVGLGTAPAAFDR